MVSWSMWNAFKGDLMYKVILSLLQINDKFKKKYIQKFWQICSHYPKISDKLRIARKPEMYQTFKSIILSILCVK